MEITFPPTFLWGIASAAHQVEGGNVYNDNWVQEHVPGTPYVESSGDTCDHYHRSWARYVEYSRASAHPLGPVTTFYIAAPVSPVRRGAGSAQNRDVSQT